MFPVLFRRISSGRGALCCCCYSVVARAAGVREDPTGARRLLASPPPTTARTPCRLDTDRETCPAKCYSSGSRAVWTNALNRYFVQIDNIRCLNERDLISSRDFGRTKKKNSIFVVLPRGLFAYALKKNVYIYICVYRESSFQIELYWLIII